MERVGTGGLVGKGPVFTTGRQGSRLPPVATALDAEASPMVGSLQQTIGVASQAALNAAKKIAIKSYVVPDRRKLTRVELKRKELLTRSEQGMVKIIFSWTGTVLGWSLVSPLLWVSVAVYVGVRAYVRQRHDITFMPEVTLSQVGILSGFLYFFLVFYVGHGYGRFNKQYGSSMSCEGRIFDTCSMAQAAMPRASAHRLMRHINGAHVLAYVGLNSTYNLENFLRHFQRANQLFTVAEWVSVSPCVPMCFPCIAGFGKHHYSVAWSVEAHL